MAQQSIWIDTNIPNEIIDIIERDVQQFDDKMEVSKIAGDLVDTSIRNSTNTWIPSSHWVCGFLWHYVLKANKQNFRYDLDTIDFGSVQYTRYEKGQFYNWHQDADIFNDTDYIPELKFGEIDTTKGINDFVRESTEKIRKLSFILQLSEFNEYDGGQVQLLSPGNKKYFVPKTKGTLIFFDSRTPHRVLKVTRGVRRSIVGWVNGPRWR